MGVKVKGAAAGDLDVILAKSAKKLRGAAKACRVMKGGVACAVLDLAAAAVDNVQVISKLVGEEAEETDQLGGASEPVKPPLPPVDEAAAPEAKRAGAAPTKVARGEGSTDVG